MNTLARVAKNAGFICGAQILRRIPGLIFIAVAARTLGVSGFGQYALILAFLSFFAVIAEGGIGVLTIKDVAQDRSRAQQYLVNALLVRTALSLIAYILLMACVLLLQYPARIILLASIGGLTLIPMSTANSFLSILNAYERMEIPALLSVLLTTLTCIFGIVALAAGWGLVGVLIVTVLANVLNLFLAGSIVKKHFLNFKIDCDIPFCRTIVKNAFPYALLSLLAVIYFRIDTVMLSKMKGEETVGLYNASYKLLEALMLIPTGLMGALFPVMSSCYKSSKDLFHSSYERSLHLLAIIAFPIAVGTTLFAREIIVLFYGAAFAPSATVLQILIWALVVMFFNAPAGNVLFNSAVIKKFIPFAIANTLFNVLLNLLLIPRWSYIGAGISTLVCEITGLFIQLYFLKLVLVQLPNLITLSVRPLCAAILMGIVIWIFQQIHLPLIPAILAAAALYFVFLVLLKGFDPEDRRMARSLMQKIMQ